MNTYKYHTGLCRLAVALAEPIHGMPLALAALEQFEKVGQSCTEFVAYLSRLINEARGEIMHQLNGTSHTLIVTTKQVELWHGDKHIVTYTLEESLRAERIELLLERMGMSNPYDGIELESYITGLVKVTA